MPVTDRVTARVGRGLIEHARQLVGVPGATEGHLLRAGLYGLDMLTADQRAEAMRLAELRRGWPQAREGDGS